jgi:hypothetical protein
MINSVNNLKRILTAVTGHAFQFYGVAWFIAYLSQAFFNQVCVLLKLLHICNNQVERLTEGVKVLRGCVKLRASGAYRLFL